MNTQDKEHALKEFLRSLPSQLTPSPTTFPLMPLPPTPEIDLISELLSHERQINQTVSSTHKQANNVLEQLSDLQTRKQNINKLLDSMTAMKEIKRLSFGLGTSSSEIYKNLVSFYQVKDKVFYCEKYVQKIQDEIGKVKINFQQQLEQQLRKTNSQNIAQLSKTLTLISSASASTNPSSDSHITKFYTEQLRRQLKTYEEDLFKIPISISSSTAATSIGSASSSNNYLFFDIAKDIMKTVVTMINNFKGNIIKIAGNNGLERVVSAMFNLVMTGIMLEIFMREKKYFDVDTTDPKKLTKSSKFKDFLNQFCAIWNQIERLRSHLLSEIPESSPSRKSFENSLDNSTNTKQLISINHQASEGIKIYTRYQFNNLLKTSTFVNSIFQMDYEYLNKIYEGFGKTGVIDSVDAQQFVVDTFSIIMKSLEKAFQSLNMLIISPLITFANTNLIQEDSFHAFTQLYNKITSKMSVGQQKYYTALILLLNTIIIMPNILRTQIVSFKIPEELNNYRLRLENQLKQLGEVCEYKAKQVINSFVNGIVESNWLKTEIKQDYRKAIDKWKGLAQEVNELFLSKVSQLHSTIILNDQFNLKSPKKIVTQQGILSLQKQVRTMITFYEVKGCSALNSFGKVLQYIQIMLADGQQNATKLFKKFNITDAQQIQRINLLRAMKVD